MEEIRLRADEADVRIDTWLSEKLEKHSRSYIQQMIREGLIKVGGKPVKANYKLKEGEAVNVTIPDAEILDVVAEKIPLDIVYEDEHIIVVNKSKGMVVHPAAGNFTGTLVNALMEYCGDRLSNINGVIRPGIVHRIDKDTSGVLVVAKNNMAHEKLSLLFKEHDIKRFYIAVVHGIVREENGRIDAPIGRHPIERKKMAVNVKNGRRAVTHFKVLERYKDASLVQLQLETGRTHQIRVHMSYIGFPLVGDTVYGHKKNRFGIEGQALHAKTLGFVHPATGEYMEFDTELPEYFNNLLKKLRNI